MFGNKRLSQKELSLELLDVAKLIDAQQINPTDELEISIRHINSAIARYYRRLRGKST